MEIKYKAFLKKEKEIRKVMNLEFENGKLTRVIVEPSQNDGFCRGENGTVLIGIEKEPKEVELLQYTGLHDNTKWEQLTQEEKEEFYYQNYSEDGKTIKYQSVKHIKPLWNGKEIYEGDIVLIEYDEALIVRGVIEYVGCGFCVSTDADNWEIDGYSSLEIIGNNPELLKE